MTDGRVAHRYAKALFDLAEEHGAVPEWEAALDSAVQTLWGDPQLKAAILGSLLSKKGKKELLEKLFEERIPRMVLNFLCLVLDKDRQAALPAIREAYDDLADEKIGLLHVKVLSPVPVNEEQAEQLKQQLKDSLGKPVRMDLAVDESLIGGIVLQIGDQLYDGSIKKQIQLLQKAMEG